MKTNQLATSAFFSAPDTLQMAGKWTGVDGSSRMGVSEREFTSIIAGVREKERNLIGQELHDNVNQILTTVKLYMEMLRPANTRDKSIKDKSVEYIMMAIEEIRKISRDLVKAKHMESGLVESINRMIDDIQFF